MQSDKNSMQMHNVISDMVASNSQKITLSMNASDENDKPHGKIRLSDIAVAEPPPERPVAARGSDQDNRTYFTKRPICRIICTATDVSILDEITSKMLGPKTDFAGVYVNIVTASHTVQLMANVTNSVHVQPESVIRLGLVIVDVIDATAKKSIGLDELCKLSRHE